MAIEPFSATTYTVNRIVNAIASDVSGNLILKDLINPDGVTLTRLIRGLVASNVSFDPSGTFFNGASNVQDALEQLNQFAYYNNTGRFIIVDPTIPNDQTVSGKIYNNLLTAVTYTNGMITNGYNSINILLMGSHLQNTSLELTSDYGVFEYDSSTIQEIPLTKNGIKIIGVGNPTIRFKDISSSKNFFVVGTNSTQELSVRIQDISFEFVNCSNVSAIKVLNSPTNSNIKDKNGLFIDGISASFVSGTSESNRVVDISNSSTPNKSNIKINNFSMGSLSSITPSATPIELIYIDHNADTVVNIENMEFVNVDPPNAEAVVAVGSVTSLTAIKANTGKLIVNNVKLDEKMYWNNTTFSDVKTLFLDATGTSHVSIQNISIVRDAYNTLEENAGGITTLNDWIHAGANTTINAQGGFDEIFNVDIYPISTLTPAPSSFPTTSSPTTSSPTTATDYLYDVKPVKGFYNVTELAFGIGDKGEIRLGNVSESDINNFSTYTNTYGIPLAINQSDNKIYFALNGILHSISGTSFTYEIQTSDWVFDSINYVFTVEHNLHLNNKYAFTTSVFNSSDEKVEPMLIKALDENTCQITMATDDPIWITIFS
jgi:hypothetical protein